MKKIKVLLSALAMVAAMALVSCGGGAGDDPTGGKSGSGAVVFDGNVDLTGKTVKNESAFTKAYDGFVITYDEIDFTGFNKLVVEAKFYDADGKEIEATWGLAQYLLLEDATGDWGANTIKTQYNLGMQDMELTGDLPSHKSTGIAFQNSTADVKFIEIKSIKFTK